MFNGITITAETNANSHNNGDGQKAIDAIATVKESLKESAFEGLKNAIANFQRSSL